MARFGLPADWTKCLRVLSADLMIVNDHDDGNDATDQGWESVCMTVEKVRVEEWWS